MLLLYFSLLFRQQNNILYRHLLKCTMILCTVLLVYKIWKHYLSPHWWNLQRMNAGEKIAILPKVYRTTWIMVNLTCRLQRKATYGLVIPYMGNTLNWTCIITEILCLNMNFYSIFKFVWKDISCLIIILYFSLKLSNW